MTREEIAAMIESIGLPCAYYEFDDNTPQEPPFVCWFFSASDDMIADNVNYAHIETLNIELYTRYKDFDLDATIESVLNAHGLVYYKETNKIDTEKIYQTSYESEVLING